MENSRGSKSIVLAGGGGDDDVENDGSFESDIDQLPSSNRTKTMHSQRQKKEEEFEMKFSPDAE